MLFNGPSNQSIPIAIPEKIYLIVTFNEGHKLPSIDKTINGVKYKCTPKEPIVLKTTYSIEEQVLCSIEFYTPESRFYKEYSWLAHYHNKQTTTCFNLTVNENTLNEKYFLTLEDAQRFLNARTN